MTMRSPVRLLLALACALLPSAGSGQGLTGTLIGTVRDEQGGVLPAARVSISSRDRAGEPNTQPTNEKGQLRFQALLPGLYTLEVSMSGFANHREESVSIGVGATIERSIVLTLAGLTEAIEVEGGSRIEARGSGFETRLWFFAGYQYLRDYDSQPAADPMFPRTYEQNKVLGNVTWQITPALRLQSSAHTEFWVNPERPTLVTPFESTLRFSATVPTSTFAHVTHIPSSNTLWDARVGRFVSAQKNEPNVGNVTTLSRFDRLAGVTSGSATAFGDFNLARTTAKATITHYRPSHLRVAVM